MNYAQSFDEFASSLGPTDLALWAGAAIILWIFFKDKLNPVSTTIRNTVQSLLKVAQNNKPVSVSPVAVSDVIKQTQPANDDIFFQLIASWKQTRDLAVRNGCKDAVSIADQMFPCLGPTVCNKKDVLS